MPLFRRLRGGFTVRISGLAVWRRVSQLRSRHRRAFTVGTATVLAVVLAGGTSASYAAVKALDGGGPQPEDALPSSVVAVAKIDLDPAFGQKRAILQLRRKFPKPTASDGSSTSVKDDALGSLLSGGDFNYDRDIKPWVGDRAAVGAVPDGRSKTGFTAVAAVQYTDVTKTRAALRRITAAQTKAHSDYPVFFALKNGYVLIADSQRHVDSFAASAQPLSATLGYQDGMAALTGDHIATAWVNIKATYLATPKTQRKWNPLFEELTTVPTGYLVVGVHAASSFVEVQGQAVGTSDEVNRNLYGGVGTTPGANLLAAYPSDTWAGADMTGLGDAVVRYYHSSGLDKDADAKATAEEELGIKLPGDLKTLFGEETAFGGFGTGDGIAGVARILSSTPTESAGVASKLLGSWVSSRKELSGLIRTERDGYYVGSSKAAVNRAATTTSHLGDTVSFKRALPDAAGAGVAIYVNVQGALRAFDADKETLHQNRYIDAFGFTADPATHAFRLRLTVK
jgi:hypothetical protein